MKNIRKLIKLIPEYRWRLVAVMLLSSGLGLLGVVTPYLFKRIVDVVARVSTGHVTQSAAVHNIITVFILLAALRAITIILSYVQERVSDMLFINVMIALRTRIFDQLSGLSLDYFEQTRTGEIMQRYSGALEFGRWIFSAVEQSLNNIFQVIFSVIVLARLNIWIGLIMLVVVPLNIYSTVSKVKQTRPIRRLWLGKAEKFSGILSEMISHIATVRSFANESVLSARFRQLQME